MAQPVLSVQVPEDREDENHAELDMGQENEEPKVSLEVRDEPDDETQRTKYGLNSPKRKKKDTDLDDQEEEDDEGAMTPATKLRQTAGINSPKQQKTMTWGNTEENENSNALAGVITQVQQTSVQPPTGAESIITQVSRDPITPMNTADSFTHQNDEKSGVDQQTTGGICSCLSTLFTCCSTPSTEQRAIQQINSQSQEKKEQKDLQPVNSTTDLLKEANAAQEEDKEPSHSQESSTVYDSALLPPLSPENKGKRCLVLDLDETLVHSSFKPVSNCDFVIPVEIDGVVHRVYVLKRPYVDEFLLECSKSYELVIFTASLSKYADPLLDQLDVHNVIAHRLFRESCTLHGSAYVKDMRRLGRRLKDTIFVDNSPHSYAFQPKNAVPIASWFDDPTDTQLRDFLPVLNTTLLQVKDVRHVLDAHNKRFSWLCRQANVDITKFES